MNTHRATATEPVVTVGMVSALVAAILALLVAFGIDIPEDVQTGILGLIAVAAPIVAGVIARKYVTPNDKVVEQEDHGMIVAGKGHDTIAEGEPIRAVHDA